MRLWDKIDKPSKFSELEGIIFARVESKTAALRSVLKLRILPNNKPKKVRYKTNKMLNQIIELINTHNQYNNNLIILLEYLSVISALSVIFSSNAIVSIIYLISLYINVSIYLYFTGLGVMGLLYILVYVGAIAILFLFILSLINLKISELSVTSNKQDIICILIILITLIYISNYVLNVESINDIISLNNNDLIGESVEIYNVLNINWNDLSSYSELKIIGELLYTQYSITMLIIGLILLLAIIGVIIITK